MKGENKKYNTDKILAMKKCFFLFLFIGLGTWSVAQRNIITDQIIVKIKDCYLQNSRDKSNLAPSITQSITLLGERFKALDTKNLYLGKNHSMAYFTILFPPGSDIDEIITEYKKLEEIEYAEPDYIGYGAGGDGFIPDDKFYVKQWGLNNNGTFQHAQGIAGIDVNMEESWSITTGDSNIIVAILDSGGKLDHPEFAGRIWQNHKEISGNNVDDDENGFTDDFQGWDFVNKDNNPSDDHGHGTNVGGIVGSTGNNGRGFAGVDWNCKLMFLKVLNSNNTGYQSSFIAAIYYAVDHGARVINMSIGGGQSDIYRDAVNYALQKNVTIVACMMNHNTEAPYYPAAFPGVIAVGSIDPNGMRTQPFFWNSSSGSNFGSHISVVAPGNYIYGLSHSSNSNYDTYWGGTSQATPHVAGVVSLMLAINPNLTPKEIKNILETTARDGIGRPEEDTPGWDKYHGWGLIDSYKALTYSVSSRKNPVHFPDFSVFPNPARSALQLIFQTPVTEGEVYILDLLGRQVYSNQKINGDKLEIDCSEIPTGIYTIVLQNKGSTHTGGKLLIIH